MLDKPFFGFYEVISANFIRKPPLVFHTRPIETVPVPLRRIRGERIHAPNTIGITPWRRSAGCMALMLIATPFASTEVAQALLVKAQALLKAS